jgi:hypothetical protein
LVCDLLTPWAVARGYSNFTDDLLARWLAPGGTSCRDARTTNISIAVLDNVAVRGEATELGTVEIREFTFWALDDAGRRRCIAGDYFEVDLSGDSWKSRPQSWTMATAPTPSGSWWHPLRRGGIPPHHRPHLPQLRGAQVLLREVQAPR